MAGGEVIPSVLVILALLAALALFGLWLAALIVVLTRGGPSKVPVRRGTDAVIAEAVALGFFAVGLVFLALVAVYDSETMQSAAAYNFMVHGVLNACGLICAILSVRRAEPCGHAAVALSISVIAWAGLPLAFVLASIGLVA